MLVTKLREHISQQLLKCSYNLDIITLEFDEWVSSFVYDWFIEHYPDTVADLNLDQLSVKYDNVKGTNQIVYKNLYSFMVIQHQVVVPFYTWVYEDVCAYGDGYVYFKMGDGFHRVSKKHYQNMEKLIENQVQEDLKRQKEQEEPPF